MKAQEPRVILSTTPDSKYLDCVDLTTTAWEKIGFTPILAFVGETMPANLKERVSSKTRILHVSPISGITDGFVSQTIRLLIPCLYGDTVSITSDVDMVPLSRKYFEDLLSAHSEAGEFVVASSDAYKDSVRYPICYLMGTGHQFSSILGGIYQKSSTSDYWLEETLIEWQKQGHGWDTDELVFSKALEESITSGKVQARKLNREWIVSEIGRVATKRIDRVCWSVDKDKLNLGDYIDCHLPRPLSYNKDLVKEIEHYVYNVL